MIDVIQNLEFFSGAEDQIYSGNFGNFLRFELGIAAHHDHAGMRRLTQGMANGFPAFAVGKISHRTGVDDIKIGRFLPVVNGIAGTFK